MQPKIFVCFVLGVLLLTRSNLDAQQADAIYHNGSILTMVGSDPSYAQALAVRQGKIAFVGKLEEGMRFQGTETKLIDLGGKALLPGFIDAHSHYINSLLVANQCKLYAPPSGPGKDVPSILETLKQYAVQREIPKGELIIGYGYDDSVMPDGQLLNRDDLDAAFPDNPVRIDHVSMHGCVLNSLALKKYGISSETKTPSGGVIVRKPGTDEPWGLIMETAFLPVVEQSESMTAQQEIQWSGDGQRLYAQAGVTTAHEGATHLPQFQTIRRASQAGGNIIDIVAFPFITEVDRILAEFPLDQWGKYQNRFKVGGVKITLDGSPQGRTAFFTTPYLTGGPSGQKEWYGEPTFPQELADKMVKKVYEMRVPLNVHCNGDASIDAFLESYQKARQGDYSQPWNVTTIHTQFMRKEHIAKFVQYKIRPSFYTLHTFYFADAHIANRGKQQAMYISPMRDAIDAGLQPTNHTDFVVAPLDQLTMLWSAVNRVSRSGNPIGNDQRVSAYEGLKCMTLWAAQQYDEQDMKGTLEVGKLADMVVLSHDPLKIDPMAIKDINVIETIKEGLTVYPSKSEQSPKLPTELGQMSYRWRAHVCDMAEVNQAAGKVWTLTKLNGQQVSVKKPPTLHFQAGNLTVFGGVNRITGSYALVGNQSVVLGELVGTEAAGPPELGKLEKEFSATLASVDAFHVEGKRLDLLQGSQVVAVFVTENP
ncbi:MAG: amidohydrolase family protein [Planctomycetota bacterium]|jgi:predicted amidohydrolase YtcJ/heat shock protein HslJ